jgi:hypothetical protein
MDVYGGSNTTRKVRGQWLERAAAWICGRNLHRFSKRWHEPIAITHGCATYTKSLLVQS